MLLPNKAVLPFLPLLVIGVSISACKAPTNSSIRLNGAGASFPAKIYTHWFSDLKELDGPRVNYQSIGSGSGRKAFIDETVDFGASDDPMKSQDIKKVNRGLIQIPLIGGTIAFGYNYDCDVRLTQKEAVMIAMGKIDDWSQLNCPPGKLLWVHRSDGSGTTRAFANSMSAFSKDWNLGTGKYVKWPSGVGGKGNEGVAGIIRNTPGAIGYVNQSYIRENIKAASIQNLSGEFLKPSRESGAKALNGINLDSNLVGSDPNPKAEGAYPIASLTWVLIYKTNNGSKKNAIKTMLKYALSEEAQGKAAKLGYVPLEGDILKKSLDAVEKIVN